MKKKTWIIATLLILLVAGCIIYVLCMKQEIAAFEGAATEYADTLAASKTEDDITKALSSKPELPGFIGMSLLPDYNSAAIKSEAINGLSDYLRDLTDATIEGYGDDYERLHSKFYKTLNMFIAAASTFSTKSAIGINNLVTYRTMLDREYDTFLTDLEKSERSLRDSLGESRNHYEQAIYDNAKDAIAAVKKAKAKLSEQKEPDVSQLTEITDEPIARLMKSLYYYNYELGQGYSLDYKKAYHNVVVAKSGRTIYERSIATDSADVAYVLASTFGRLELAKHILPTEYSPSGATSNTFVILGYALSDDITRIASERLTSDADKAKFEPMRQEIKNIMYTFSLRYAPNIEDGSFSKKYFAAQTGTLTLERANQSDKCAENQDMVLQFEALSPYIIAFVEKEYDVIMGYYRSAKELCQEGVEAAERGDSSGALKIIDRLLSDQSKLTKAHNVFLEKSSNDAAGLRKYAIKAFDELTL